MPVADDDGGGALGTLGFVLAHHIKHHTVGTGSGKFLNPREPLLAHDKARHVGEALAVVVAETRDQAEDAAELVALDLEDLPAVVDPVPALSPDSPLIHEQFGTNLIGEFSVGKGDAAGVMARAPHRLYNIAHNQHEELMHLIAVLEEACGRKARIDFQPMQPGDVQATFADISAIARDIGFAPGTAIETGVPRFVSWYRDYHGK